jgi:hypothetical protein
MAMYPVQPEVVDSWFKFLNPQSLKCSLVSTSIFLVAWETFERGIIGHLEGFYLIGFDQEGYKFDDNYKADVLSRDKSVFRASILWFKEHGVIDDKDLMVADRARQHRNDIAHNLPAYVAKASHSVDESLLGELCALLNKVDVWWIRNVEIPTNSDFDDQDVDAIPDSEITSGNMLFLTLLFNIATGGESDANRLYEEFVRGIEARIHRPINAGQKTE